MHTLQKTLALMLTVSLLGQNALVAAPAQIRQAQPQNLAEYQQRAKADMERVSWLKNEGKYFLGIGGTAVAAFLLQGYIHRRELKDVRHEYWKDLQKHYKETSRTLQAERELLATEKRAIQEQAAKEQAQLQQRINLLTSEKEALNKQLSQANIKINGLTISAQTQRTKRLNAEAAFKSREAELTEQLEKLQKRFNQKKQHYTDLVHYSKSLDSELAKYERLFSPVSTEEERAILRKQLAKEPWLLKVTPQQREEFLTIIDQASQYRRGTYREAGAGFMRHLIRQSMEKNMPLYERLIGMCRHVFHSKNLVTVGIIVALGMSAHSVKAQKMADRINTNFDLFLNATPAELAEMEKDPAVREVCIQGAEALHLMSQFDEQETEELLQGIHQPVSAPVNGSRGTIQLAR